MKLNGHNKKAFTLIELLVVVAIIGILAAVGVVAYDGYTKSAKRNAADAICKSVIQEVKNNWTGCMVGRPCYLKSGNSGKVDMSANWCSFNSGNPAKTNMRAQAFVDGKLTSEADLMAKIIRKTDT